MTPARRFTCPVGNPPRRLDQFLSECLPEISRSRLQRLIDDGHVTLDGCPGRAAARLKGGETAEVVLPEAAPVATLPEQIPLTILYEDADLVVIDKPAGLVVHPAAGHAGGTLVNALLHHCRDLSGIGGERRPGIVHRLDKETSGVMVAAKNDAAHEGLTRQFKVHSITRRYLALVQGLVPRDEGEIDRPIGRHPVDRKRMSTRSRHGRRAVTRWRVLRRYVRERLTLLELTLETGRTHQIRVHFSEMNLPLVGDQVYGKPSRFTEVSDPGLRQSLLRLKRQFLHAHVLGFRHPRREEPLEFSAPLPPELRSILNQLDTAAAGAAIREET